MSSRIVKETIEDLEELGHKVSDVLWVGSYDGEFAMSWKEFSDKFKNLEYDDGFGRQEIAADLVVVGEDWWLEREEYDGAEQWTQKRYPKVASGKSFDKIIGNGDNLARTMEGEENE